MKHARTDYDRIQDPSGKIPDDEPVFLIRAQDVVSSDAVRAWAILHDKAGGDPLMSAAARQHALLMDAWKERKLADAPADTLKRYLAEQFVSSLAVTTVHPPGNK